MFLVCVASDQPSPPPRRVPMTPRCPAVGGDVSFPRIRGSDFDLIRYDRDVLSWGQSSFSSVEFRPHEAGNLATLSRHRLLRSSLDGVDRASTPSFARSLPVDLAGSVDSRLGGHNVGAGPDVGAEPHSTTASLRQNMIVPPLSLSLPLSVSIAGGRKSTHSPNSARDHGTRTP